MFAIKNAVKNIYRYKDKYKIFAILYFILIVIASIFAAIFVQINTLTGNMIRDFGSVVTFSEIIVHHGENPFQFNNIKREDFSALMDIEHIDDILFFNYNFSTAHLKPNITELQIELHTDGNIIAFINNSSGEITKSDFSVFAPAVIISGYDKSLLHFSTQDFNLNEGRMFENDKEAVISINSSSEDNADSWNRLKLGDMVVVKNDDGVYKEFTVVGILEQNRNDDVSTMRKILHTTLEGAEYFQNIAIDQRAAILVGAEAVNLGYDVLLSLASSGSFTNYQMIKEYLFNMNLMIELPFSNSQTILNLIYTIRGINLGFILLSATAIIIVTIITTVILLNNRKYEIAVLRSVGMKKSRIIANYLIENLTFVWGITIIAFMIAQFIIPLFMRDTFAGIQDLVAPEMFEQLTNGGNFGLILQNAGLVFGGTTAVVMLSLILACINIVRFEPLKIFNKQY